MKKIRAVIPIIIAIAAVAMITLGTLALAGFHPFSPAVGAFGYICFGVVMLSDAVPSLRLRRGEILMSLEGRPEDVADFKAKLERALPEER